MDSVALNRDERLLLAQLSYKDFAGYKGGSIGFLELLDRMVIQKNKYSDGEIYKDNLTKEQWFCKQLAQDMRANPEKYPGLSSLTLVGYANHNDGDGSGYVGYAFRDANDQLVVVSRGTEESMNPWNKDWNQDMSGADEQIADAKDFVDSVLRPGEPILFLGHSLGGGISIALQEIYDNLHAVFSWVVNSAYFDKKDREHRAPENVHSICTSGDALQKVGFASACSKNGEERGFDIERVTDPDGLGAVESHTQWDYGTYPPRTRSMLEDRLGPAGLGSRPACKVPFAIDPALSSGAAGKLDHAALLISEADSAIDSLAKAILRDAMDLRRDGDADEGLGRSNAINELPGNLRLLLAFGKGMTLDFSVDVRTFFGGGLSTGTLERAARYARLVSKLFDQTESVVKKNVSSL